MRTTTCGGRRRQLAPAPVSVTRAAGLPVWRGALLGAVLALLAGCAALDERREAPPDADPSPEGAPEPAPEAREAPGSAAVRSLLADARAASDDGDHGRAGALLERALRIAPDNAVLWHNLAIVRYREAAYAEAESLAQRSLSHDDADAELRRRNWELIAVSRRMRGDTAGAEQARERLQGIRGVAGE